jgi:hypothetical protein
VTESGVRLAPGLTGYAGLDRNALRAAGPRRNRDDAVHHLGRSPVRLVGDGTGRVPENSSGTRQDRSDIFDPAVLRAQPPALVVVPQRPRASFVTG